MAHALQHPIIGCHPNAAAGPPTPWHVPGRHATCASSLKHHTDASAPYSGGGGDAPQCSRRRLAAGALASLAALPLLPTASAWAYNVRLEDVESPAMRAALEAATSGRFAEAERLFRVVLAQDPDSASAHSNLGNVHTAQGRVAEAVEDYGRAIALAPDAPVPYLNRAIAREALGAEAEAAGDAARAQALWGAALADCDAAIDRDPKEFAAWFDRGNVCLRLADYSGALDAFATAADLAPGLAGYRLRHAQLLFQQGQSSEAARMLRGVVRKYGNYAEARVSLAAVEWAAGHMEAAEEQLEAAQRLEDGWGDMRTVRAATRWPPALYDAMERLLRLQAPPAPAGGAA